MAKVRSRWSGYVPGGQGTFSPARVRRRWLEHVPGAGSAHRAAGRGAVRTMAYSRARATRVSSGIDRAPVVAKGSR